MSDDDRLIELFKRDQLTAEEQVEAVNILNQFSEYTLESINATFRKINNFNSIVELLLNTRVNKLITPKNQAITQESFAESFPLT